MKVLEPFFQYRDRLLFFFRYGITGATGGAIQILGLYIWVSLLGLQEHYLWGVVVSYCVALVVTFTLQKYWTFRDYSHGLIARQMVWYAVISLGNLSLNALLLHAGKLIIESAGLDFFRIWYLLVQSVAVVASAGVSFLLNRYITFRSVVP